MKGAWAAAARTIIEYLIIRLHPCKEKQQPETSSTTEGALVLSVDIENSLQDVKLSHCTTIISSKGDKWRELLSDQLHREIESLLLPLCLSKTRRGTGCPPESPHTMPFQFSFELCETSEVLKRDCVAMKQFIHRISLVCTTIKFHYCVKVNGSISAETYSSGSQASISLPDGKRLLAERNHFMRSVSQAVTSSCDKIHPVAGEPVGLFIPEEAAARGFSGQLRLMPVAALCPCQKAFPNWPTKLTSLSVFLYDPAGLPVPITAKEASSSFFEDPSCFAVWERYSYRAHLTSQPHLEEDTAEPDIRYEIDSNQEHGPDAVEESLLLFLFLIHSDPFQDKPAYNFCDRQVILSHLLPILLCSQLAVKDAIQGVVCGILEQHGRAVQEQQKLAQALPIMTDAISCIVSSSCDNEFRRKCLQHLQASDTRKLQLTLKETFNEVILKQRKPSSVCDIQKPVPKKEEARQLSIDNDGPSPTHQNWLSSIGSARPEQAGRDSHGKEGLLSNRSEFGGISKSKMRRPTIKGVFEEDSEQPDACGEGKKKRDLLADASVSASVSSATGTSRDVLPDKSQQEFVVPAMSRTGTNKTTWQDDDFWNWEVSNLAEWTS
ncbi:hypothetical protein JRQ81_009494 [Phrynocephalus forsythii]|uniref:Type 2 DNA topoisomerase 6 subunit B-like n=1 Tax=Phrynocephalus forsythii TaxID=171643 RepID=A0A9Q1ASK0_9SAUR|nr:hypothetical protein JRQ81_009494 [Phrynocephalus forsythii]